MAEMGVRFSSLLPIHERWNMEVQFFKGDAGSFNGRTRVFGSRYGRSIRSPAAKIRLRDRLMTGPLALTQLMLVRLQLPQPWRYQTRIVYEPVQVRNRSSILRGAGNAGVMTRWEGRSSPKRVSAGSNPVTPARFEREHGIAAGASGFQSWVTR